MIELFGFVSPKSYLWFPSPFCRTHSQGNRCSEAIERLQGGTAARSEGILTSRTRAGRKLPPPEAPATERVGHFGQSGDKLGGRFSL